MKLASRLAHAAGVLILFSTACFAHSEPAAAPVHKSEISASRIETLSRVLRDKKSHWAYARLTEIAQRKSSGILGKRAALALGYFDYQNGDFQKAAKWLALAQGDLLLGDYDLYWQAETNLALNDNQDALSELELLRRNYPYSVVTEQALQALGVAAIAANHPADAVAALEAYGRTDAVPQLLFLRGEAREQAGQLLDAAKDYQTVYLRFPLSDQARSAEEKIATLSAQLGTQLQPISLEDRVAHAEALFDAERWSDARNEYNALLPSLTGAQLERAEVRVLECGVESSADSLTLAALAARQIADPDVDAERDYTLADYYRGVQNEPLMLAAVQAAQTRAPSSEWTERVLFLAGNYYWVNLQRDQASTYYAQLARQFASSQYADAALWRVAWTATIERHPDATQQLEAHLLRYPDSEYTPDTLYWLGRLAEESGERARARGFYVKLQDRFAQTYFAMVAAKRLRVISRTPRENDDVLAVVPPIPQAISMEDPPSVEADARRARAAALESIAFDSSAMLELRAGYAETHQPALLLEAAREAVAAKHCGVAIALTRELYPQLESRSFADVPRSIWLAAYALPYQQSIRRWAARKRLDPMLVAGLIHQESAFNPQAISYANAVGLMQLEPYTARILAREQRVRYSQERLLEPDYNVRLGTAYLAKLDKLFDGNVEEILAAYNAGEDRVTEWTTGQNYREPAEFVDSIPFSQTRDYVEIVARNAAIYRHLYLAGTERREVHTQHKR